MKNKKIFFFIAVLSIQIFLTGCIRLYRPAASIKTYLISGERQPTPKQQALVSIFVQQLTVAAQFESKNFTYRTSEFIYESDYYHRFFIAPTAMITQALQDWFNQSNIFSLASTSQLAQFIVKGKIVNLYGDFSSNPKAVVAIQFNVFLQSNPNKPIFQKTYSYKLPLLRKSTADLIQGFQTASQNIFSDLEKDIEELAKNLPPRT